MTKTSADTIARAGRLTESPSRPADPITACNLCGAPAERLRAMRECDEYDRPLPGPASLLFIGERHGECRRKLDKHARLYRDDMGEPGTFPLLCGRCVHRRGFECTHPKLKQNGGPGLAVTLDGPNGFLCRRGRGRGCEPMAKNAVKCEGHRHLLLLPQVSP